MAMSASSQILWQKVPIPTEVKKWTCRKKDIHPEFYKEAKVYCKGKLVMTTGGTQKEYVVDTWSGNHSAYTGEETTSFNTHSTKLEKFYKQYGKEYALLLAREEEMRNVKNKPEVEP